MGTDCVKDDAEADDPGGPWRMPRHGEQAPDLGTLGRAARDYRMLLDRGYPDQPSIKLVGDRYRLTGVDRGMLFRGVFSAADSERRSRRLTDPSAVGDAGGAEGSTGSEELAVDGHNVLFTLWNYLAGRPLVLATDGFTRDIGGTRSRLPHDERFSRLAEVLCRALAGCFFGRITVLLDDPLPWSRQQAAEIERTWTALAGSGGSPPALLVGRTEASVDAVLARVQAGRVATSDTGIIDRCAVPIVDLGGAIVRDVYGAQAVPMAALCATA